MTAASGEGKRAVTVGVCCLVAALSYSGAVTITALLAFVLPAVVLSSAVTAGLARLSTRVAVFGGLLSALVVAEIVNLVSGTAHGPAARSAFVAAALSVLAVASALGPAPALFAAAVVGILVGALGLGAGGEVAPVAVATAVVTAIALAVIEGQDRRWMRRPPHLWRVVAVAVLVGATAAVVTSRADSRIQDDPAVLSPGAVDPAIRPPQVLGDPNPPTTPPPTGVTRTEPDTAPPSNDSSALRTFWLAVLAGAIAVLVGTALRILWVALSWRRLRRRLRRGSEREQVAGAWVWAARRLRVAGWPMPISLSPDAVSAGRGTGGLPRQVRQPLRQLADLTTSAVYAPQDVPDDDPGVAWSTADEVGRGAVRTLTAASRFGFAVRSVNSRPSRSAAPASATPEELRL